MIITRTPLRISLGGGGTDLPSYYRESGHGFLIAAAITKYVYIAVHRNFDEDLLLKYSAVERIPTAEQATHPLLRSCLAVVGIDSGIEITSMADIPTGTGLGSSGAFTVGVLKALRAYQREHITNVDLAAQACHVEIEMLNEPVGKQDQYIAAVGGVTGLAFHDDESVDVVRLELADATRNLLDDNLLLFFTGLRRSASEVLAEQQRPPEHASAAPALADNLARVRDIGYQTKKALEGGDVAEFGSLLTDQWRLKYERSPGAVHDQVDACIQRGIAAGALGGKLVGAGGGGFLLFYAEHKRLLRAAMAELGLEEVRFTIDYQGATTLVDG
jgi:D-glycero-alpha-D-manno-heptose-7-phosphate kinase